MSVSCDSKSLVANAACLECGIPQGMQLSVLISLFCKIAGMNCDPATLMANAACLECGIPQGMQLSVLIYLACQIANGGGGVAKFASAQLPLTATSYSVAHGLGGSPAIKEAYLVCTANDANSGYVVGDETPITVIVVQGFAVTSLFDFGANATNIFAVAQEVPVGNEAAILIIPKGGGVAVNPSSFNNFALKFYAWL